MASILDFDLVVTERYESKNDNAWWEGWTLNVFTPDRRGATRIDGAFHNGQWGIIQRVDPNEKGRYRFRA